MRGLVVTLFLLAGCGGGLGPFGSVTHIDWIDFIMFDGITYVAPAQYGAATGRPLRESDLGSEFARVTFKLDGNVRDPGYVTRDGDAAFIEPGTPVYAVKGYSTAFRLAAPSRGTLVLYEADTSPRATKGRDLLDLEGKVTYIGVNSEVDGTTEVGAIRDSAVVARLVQYVAEAPVDQSRRDQEGERYFVAFHLVDGTAVTRSFSVRSSELSRGIMVPREFGEALRLAVTNR
jgi:hypothetical protein